MMTNKKVLDILSQMTMNEKILCLHGQIWDKYRANQAGFVRGIDRLGIPDLFIADGESGVNTNWEATAYPSKVGLAASFDRETARKYGECLGREAKAAGIHILLTPRVNIVRDYIDESGKTNGGNFQTYGEDPVLNGELGAQEATGIQTRNNAIANAKQMLGSSNGSAQGAGNVEIDPQTLHEIYLKPFEPVIKSGVGSAMSNYNQINGTWTCDLGEVHDKIVRKEWGFEGVLINDWLCLYDPNSIRHGVTLEMPGNDFYDQGSAFSLYGDQLKAAVADKSQPVTEADIDRAVYYYLNMLDRFGMLHTQRIPGPLDSAAKEKGIEDARALAGKTAVLLKNDGILPLNPKTETIAVIGPTGNRQAIPVFKEAAYGFRDRLTGTCQVLAGEYGKGVSYAVGNDLDGIPVPSRCLRPEKGGAVNGLKRFTGGFIYNTLGDGFLREIPTAIDAVIDPEINYRKENSLPYLIPDLLMARGTQKYYMWTGFLCPEETGMYRISLQSYMPGVAEFEENQIKTQEAFIATTGNLYFAEADEGLYKRIGIGPRIFMNGGAVPNSEVVPCMDGWNNAGGTVYLEAGKEYGIFFNQCGVYRQPVQVRLAWTTPSMAEAAREEAAAAAKKADKAVVFVWHKSSSDSLTLSEKQNELVETVARANPNTVVVLNNGDPIEMPWLDKVRAVLEMWFPGQEGALATADVLTGRVNPAGRLPISFPKKISDTAVRDPRYPERYAPPGRINKKDAVHPNTAVFSEGIMVGYRWFDSQGIEPLFPFGYGQSYTAFSYENLRIEERDGFEAVCTIRNTGGRDGEEVVQCYLGKPDEIPPGVQAAEKSLADFARIFLKAGEASELRLTIPHEALKYFDKDSSSWKLFTGSRKVLIGASSRDIRLEAAIVVK